MASTSELLVPCRKKLYDLTVELCNITAHQTDNCAVCLTESIGWETNCTHKFCFRCITTVIRDRGTCPLCRSTVNLLVKLNIEPNLMANERIGPVSPMNHTDIVYNLPASPPEQEIEDAMRNLPDTFTVWNTIIVTSERIKILSGWPPSQGHAMATFIDTSLDKDRYREVYRTDTTAVHTLLQAEVDMPSGSTTFFFKCMRCAALNVFKKPSSRSNVLNSTPVVARCLKPNCGCNMFSGLIRIWRPPNGRVVTYCAF